MEYLKHDISSKLIKEQRSWRITCSVRAVLRYFKYFYHFWILIRLELSSNVKLSLRHSLRAWRYGFTRFSYRMYGLDRSGQRDGLIPDACVVRQLKFNELFHESLLNKVNYMQLMQLYGMPCPELIGYIRKGFFHSLELAASRQPSHKMLELLRNRQRLALKPVRSRHGLGFIKLEQGREGCRVNGLPTPLQPLKKLVADLDHYLVCEFVEQGGFAASLYPDTPNTMRILTLWDLDKSQPFIAQSVQRIGVSRSFPVDCFNFGRGGLSALIDRDSGELGPGAFITPEGEVRWHERHPETNAPIKGLAVPGWNHICSRVLGCAAQLPFTPCIAWDLLQTDKGFSVIEGNTYSGLTVLQVHGLLLDDPRTRRFYEHYGVIRPRPAKQKGLNRKATSRFPNVR